MKLVATIIAVLFLAACKEQTKYGPDPEKYSDVFFKCLDAAGLHGAQSFTAAKNAGSGDVVYQCRQAARSISWTCRENCN